MMLSHARYARIAIAWPFGRYSVCSQDEGASLEARPIGRCFTICVPLDIVRIARRATHAGAILAGQSSGRCASLDAPADGCDLISSVRARNFSSAAARAGNSSSQ